MDKIELLKELENMGEIEPDKYDGSYELMREIIKSYSGLDNYDKCTYLDINAIYMMSVGTWKFNIQKKKEYIGKGCLPKSEKERLYEILDKVWDNACNKVYENVLDRPSVGMFGAGIFSFVKKITEQCANLKFFKGKIKASQHIKKNVAHKERFYMEYDEFSLNRAENRIIKTTLLKLQILTESAENSKEIRQLLTAFEEVDISVNYEKDFACVVIDRNTKDYESLIQWSKVILYNKSFTTFSGANSSKALLFPMESVYESYVAKEIKRIFTPDGWQVRTQDKGLYLFTKPYEQFALRPDIVIKKEDKIIILDTKWKRLFDNEKANYGISQADMYQMYVYSKRYGTADTWLLYPVNNEMRNHKQISFESEDGTRVSIFFVDVAAIEDSLNLLKKQITGNLL